MFTNRCSAPFLISRSPRPEYRLSRSVITSASVEPSAVTVFSPLVTGRRMVGTDTETLIVDLLVAVWLVTGWRSRVVVAQCRGGPGRNVRRPLDRLSRRRRPVWTISTGSSVDHPVDDPVRAELVGVRLPGGHQHVVRLRLAGVGDVGPARVRLGRGVRVVDDDHLLVARRPAPGTAAAARRSRSGRTSASARRWSSAPAGSAGRTRPGRR